MVTLSLSLSKLRNKKEKNEQKHDSIYVFFRNILFQLVAFCINALASEKTCRVY